MFISMYRDLYDFFLEEGGVILADVHYYLFHPKSY